jgi:hypothetical protein
MDAEHKRPLAAFVVVSATSALLLGQSLVSQSPSADDRSAASQTSGRSNNSSAPSSSPASGQAVDGVTSTPNAPTVKSIGRAPMLMARGDDGLGIAVGAVRDPSKKLTDPVPTRDKDASPGPQGQPGQPEPKPSGGPAPDTDEDGSPGNSGGHSQGPRGNSGPRGDGVLPTPQHHGSQ